MSDIRVRVRYHDIEVEMVVPIVPRYGLEVYKDSSGTHGALLSLVSEATKQVEALITAGRKEVAP